MKIAIVDDHPLIAEGFSEILLAFQPQAEVFTASDQYGLFSLLERQNIEFIFLDIRLKYSDARDFLPKLRAAYPDVKIVIISSIDDPKIIEMVLNQGADGYLLKSDPLKSHLLFA